LNGLYRELFNIAREQARAAVARRRTLRHYGANARKHIEQALCRQLGNHLLGGVGVNLHGAGQRSARGERIARSQLATEDGLLSGEYNLLGYRHAGLDN